MAMIDVTDPRGSVAIEEAETRHSMVRRVLGVGAVLFGALAARGTTAANASCHIWTCCCLASYNTCGATSYGNFYCPSGWSKRTWYCCSGLDLVGCGECVKGGTTCQNADSFTCSYGWIARRGGC
jgi:hypothetical protein